jgi:hypothetical protein
MICFVKLCPLLFKSDRLREEFWLSTALLATPADYQLPHARGQPAV